MSRHPLASSGTSRTDSGRRHGRASGQPARHIPLFPQHGEEQCLAGVHAGADHWTERGSQECRGQKERGGIQLHSRLSRVFLSGREQHQHSSQSHISQGSPPHSSFRHCQDHPRAASPCQQHDHRHWHHVPAQRRLNRARLDMSMQERCWGARAWLPMPMHGLLEVGEGSMPFACSCRQELPSSLSMHMRGASQVGGGAVGHGSVP